MEQILPEGAEVSDPVLERWHSLVHAVNHEPERAVSAYDALRTGAPATIVQAIETTFGESMEAAKTGNRIREGAVVLQTLADAFGKGRKVDRTLLVKNATYELIAIGVAASEHEPECATLDGIGQTIETFVLRGTGEQLFIAELAIHLGIAPKIPPELARRVVLPMIRALAPLLELGAPGTRDGMVEALGGLLKHLPAKRAEFMLPKLSPRQRDHEGSPNINHSYEERRRRHERIIKAIAGDPQQRKKFFETIQMPIGNAYERRSDYLRALPAMWRQEVLDQRDATRELGVKLLLEAATLVEVASDASVHVRAAFARYQEYVFRTLGVMLDRGVPATPWFDTVVAQAVQHIPQTLIGPLELCNAQVRATVAILRTATRVAARMQNSKTDAALDPLYKNLGGECTEWRNPGIAEGCLRGLPALLWDRDHDTWTRAALETLFKELRREPDLTDFARMHLRLSATASLRRVLIALTERVHTQLLEYHTDRRAESRKSEVEQTIRALLAEPSAERVLTVFQATSMQTMNLPGRVGATISEYIVGAAAMETDVLRRMPALFADWPRIRAARQLLLIRILGMQLRAASQDSVKIGRIEVLRKIFDGLSEATLSSKDRDDMLWKLLSDLPSGAAEAADADLHDFVKYRSGYIVPTQPSDTNDLPGYVLAMVSDKVSYHLAADIARQVDLNRRRQILERDTADFSGPLYQVMLRGPNIAIFDHLLARITEERDRTLLRLFRDHIETVGDCKLNRSEAIDVRRLVKHALTLIPQLKRHPDKPLLCDLAMAMKWYVALASDTPNVWESIVGPSRRRGFFGEDDGEAGGLGALLRILDRLAEEKPESAALSSTRPFARKRGGNFAEPLLQNRRAVLAELCFDEAVRLRLAVEFYLRVPVGHFDAAAGAMHGAIDAVSQIEEKIQRHCGLQPPEQTILLALLRNWRDMFARTIDWWIDAPRRCVEARQPEAFWKHFVRDPDANKEPAGPWLDAALLLERGHLGEAIRRRLYGRLEEEKLERPVPKEAQPPIPAGQDLAFERYYVEWMASELDIDNLHRVLFKRWKLFRLGYAFITRLGYVLLLIALPCLIAAVLYPTRFATYAGIGFFLYGVGIAGLAMVALLGRPARALMNVIKARWRERRKQPPPRKARERHPYRFKALLPRLFKLIVVPVAVLVDFEHSYLYPMHASDLSLGMLMVMAFLSATFFIRRELHSQTTELSRMAEAEPPQADVRRRVRQVVSIGLAQAFAVSLLFSSVFESNYIVNLQTADAAHAKIVQGDAEKESDGAATHHGEYFLHILPRHVKFDLAGYRSFDFYPTLILAWTALSLFFGVFLDGFFKGERLRGETPH